jgi:hypothetical protein
MRVYTKFLFYFEADVVAYHLVELRADLDAKRTEIYLFSELCNSGKKLRSS